MIDISIIIRNFNNQDYIGRAIRSVLKQSYTQIEVVVVDDASTDQSHEVIKSFGDKITYIPLDVNVGVAEAANIGLRNSLGRFVLLVDSDDYISEHTVLFMREILDKNKTIGFIYADIIRVDDEENILDRVDLDTPDKIFEFGAGIMFRKSYLEQIGLYDKELRNREDYDLLKRYIRQWSGFHLPLPLYRYRQHSNNMTKDERARKEWKDRIDKKLDLPKH